MSAERSRQFLDSNVLVYAHDSSAGGKHDRAVQLLDQLAGDDAGALSVQVLEGFFVTVTGQVPNRLSGRDVAELIVMPTHAPTGADVLYAIDIHARLELVLGRHVEAQRLRAGLRRSEDLSQAGYMRAWRCATPSSDVSPGRW